MNLDLGCGKYKQVGYIGLDKIKEEGVDIVCNFDKELPIPDNKIVSLIACNSIQYAKDIDFTINEIYRICAHGAQVCIVLPCDKAKNLYEIKGFERKFKKLKEEIVYLNEGVEEEKYLMCNLLVIKKNLEEQELVDFLKKELIAPYQVIKVKISNLNKYSDQLERKLHRKEVKISKLEAKNDKLEANNSVLKRNLDSVKNELSLIRNQLSLIRNELNLTQNTKLNQSLQLVNIINEINNSTNTKSFRAYKRLQRILGRYVDYSNLFAEQNRTIIDHYLLNTDEDLNKYIINITSYLQNDEILYYKIKAQKVGLSSIDIIGIFLEDNNPIPTIGCEILDSNQNIIRSIPLNSITLKNNQISNITFEPILDSQGQEYYVRFININNNYPKLFALYEWQRYSILGKIIERKLLVELHYLDN